MENNDRAGFYKRAGAMFDFENLLRPQNRYASPLAVCPPAVLVRLVYGTVWANFEKGCPQPPLSRSPTCNTLISLSLSLSLSL